MNSNNIYIILLLFVIFIINSYIKNINKLILLENTENPNNNMLENQKVEPVKSNNNILENQQIVPEKPNNNNIEKQQIVTEKTNNNIIENQQIVSEKTNNNTLDNKKVEPEAIMSFSSFEGFALI